MSKNWIMPAALLLLGSVGTSQSHPLDSPDIVYIDGLPCNSACQSYMAWTRRKTSLTSEHSAPVESVPVEVAPPIVKPAPAKPMLRSAHDPARRPAAVRRESSKPAAPRVARPSVPLSPAPIAKPAGDAAVTLEPAPTSVAALPPADSVAAASKSRTVQEQIAAATALAEQATIESATPAPRQQPASAEVSVTGAVDPGNPEPAASAAADNGDNRVALLMTRTEIKSVSDLAGKDVAIEGQQSAFSSSIQAAMASAGAAQVRLDEGPLKAIDRLVGGEVQAAVLTLVSPEAAAWFPDVPGYTIFRIPLAQGSSKIDP